MLRALFSCCDPNSSYDSTHFTEDLVNKGSCCVLCDADEVDSNCCSCKRSAKEKYDWLDCGYQGEEKNISPMALKKITLLRYIRWGYAIQAVFWILIGGIMVINPDAFAFHVVISKSNIDALSTDGYRQFQTEERMLHNPAKKEIEFSDVLSSMGVGGIFSKMLGSESTTETEKDMFVKTLDDVSREMRIQAAKSAVATPTKILGSAFVFFGVYSIVQRQSHIDIETSSVSTINMMWNGCIIIGLASAASGASGGFVTFMIIICAISGVFWFFVRDRILHIKLVMSRIPKNEQSDDDNEEQEGGDSKL